MNTGRAFILGVILALIGALVPPITQAADILEGGSDRDRTLMLWSYAAFLTFAAWMLWEVSR